MNKIIWFLVGFFSTQFVFWYGGVDFFIRGGMQASIFVLSLSCGMASVVFKSLHESNAND